MKTKPAGQRAGETMESVASWSADDVSPNSSTTVGVTLLGNLEDALAVLRTIVLLASNLKAKLFLDLTGKDIVAVHFEEAPYSRMVSELLDSARTQLYDPTAPAFVMEINAVAATFISGGSIAIRIRNVNAGLIATPTLVK
jgi:hypothetical protein